GNLDAAVAGEFPRHFSGLRVEGENVGIFELAADFEGVALLVPPEGGNDHRGEAAENISVLRIEDSSRPRGAGAVAHVIAIALEHRRVAAAAIAARKVRP